MFFRKEAGEGGSIDLIYRRECFLLFTLEARKELNNTNTRENTMSHNVTYAT